MTTYYLYHKISPKGLNYLGSTRNKDPFKYRGSGKRWKLHLKKHRIRSEDITTIILLETKCKNELREQGLYYSDLYDIVNSNEWANLIPESGDGVFRSKLTEEHRKKISEAGKGRKPSEETRKKISEASRGRKHSEESKRKISAARQGISIKHSEETIEKIKRLKTGKNKKGVEVINIETKEIFDSVRRASLSCGINERTLYRQIRDEKPNCKFRFLNENYEPAARPFSQKGLKRSEETKERMKNASTRGRKVKNKLTGEIFDCISDAAKSVNMKQNTLSLQLARGYKSRFEYYTE